MLPRWFWWWVTFEIQSIKQNSKFFLLTKGSLVLQLLCTSCLTFFQFEWFTLTGEDVTLLGLPLRSQVIKWDDPRSVIGKLGLGNQGRANSVLALCLQKETNKSGEALHAQSPIHHRMTGSCLTSHYSQCVPQHLKAQISFSLTRCDVLTQSREVDVWLLLSPPQPSPHKIQRAYDPAHPPQYLQLGSCPVFKLSHRVAPFQNQGRKSFSSLYLTSKGASGEAVEIRDRV